MLLACISLGLTITGSLLFGDNTSHVESSQSPSNSWIAYGDVRGYLEPCGCDPSVDLGGIRRLKEVVSHYQSKNSALWTFDLGNWPEHAKSTDGAKLPFLLEASQSLAPTARLLNRREITHRALLPDATKELKTWQKRTVLSNMRDRKLSHLASDHVLTDSLMVFGYTFHPSISQWVNPWSVDLAQAWHKTMRDAGDRSRILLFSGSDEHLQAIVKSGLFTTVIASSNAPDNHVADPSRDRNIQTIIRLHTDSQVIYQVPPAGQGVVLGGQLQQKKPDVPNIFGAISSTEHSPLLNTQKLPDAPALSFTDDSKQLVIWLDREHENADRFESLFKRYNQVQHHAFAAGLSKRLAAFENTSYVGAEACAGCHPKAYATWKESAHAKALTTLEKNAKDQDGECVTCHVVGFKQGGFVAKPHTPHLAGVQCENCHGPRKEHVTNPMATSGNPAAKRELCATGCHHPPHTSRFAWDEFWPKIAHGKD